MNKLRTESSVLSLGALLLFLLPVNSALAGTTGQLGGRVVDDSGSPLIGVSASATSPAQIGGTQQTQTNEDGRFGFPRLAPGDYVVSLELDGFITQELTEVQVWLDRTTELHVVLPKASFGEAINVVEATPVVDPRQVSTGQVFTSEYLQQATVGMNDRRFIKILDQTAGVGYAGIVGVSVHGSSSNESAYLVDGTEITDPYDQYVGISSLSFEAIDQINFHTSGFEAEYGLATGGVVNLITKSGGNTLSGTFDARYVSSDFAGKGDHHDPDVEPFETSDISASAGGAIQQDRLWYFTAVQRYGGISTPVRAPASQDYTSENYLGKLTWRPGVSWSVEGKLLSTPFSIDHANASQFRTREANSMSDWRTLNAHLNVSGVLSSNTLLDVRLASLRSESDSLPQDGDLATIGHFNVATGERYGNFSSQTYDSRERTTGESDLTWFTEGLGGSHEIKGGLRYSATGYSSNTCSTGGGRVCAAGDEGFFFRDWVDGSGAHIPDVLVVEEALGTQDFKGSIASVYAQDGWRVRPELTLKAGVRWDHSRQENDVGDVIADLEMLQPRLGLAWDVGGETRNILRASWGQYMHPSSLHIAEFAAERSAPFEYWASCSSYVSADPAECSALVASWELPYRTDPEGWDPAGWWLYQVISPEPGRTSSGLEPMYADELLVAFERELFRRTSLELSYVKKDTRDMFEDTCNGNLPTPTAGAECSHWVVANLAALRRDYEGWNLRFESRALDRLHLNASYVYSDSKGSTFGSGLNSAFDQYPFHFANKYGYLPDHSRHRVKLNGFAHFPRAVTISVNARWDSEWRWTPFSRSEPGMSYGFMFTEPRGSRSADGYYTLNVQLAKGFRLGPTDLKLIGTVHNLLSPEGVEGLCTAVSGCGEFELGDATSWQLPRSYEVGLRLEF